MKLRRTPECKYQAGRADWAGARLRAAEPVFSGATGASDATERTGRHAALFTEARFFTGTGLCRYNFVIALALLFLTGADLVQKCAAQEGDGPLIFKQEAVNQQLIPMVVLNAEGQVASVARMKMTWQPTEEVATSGDLPQFEFDQALTPQQVQTVQAQLWLAALSASVVWQEPWRRARWRIEQPPLSEEDAYLTAMAVAMIATSSGQTFPQDLTVLGGLNFDNSLGPVYNLEGRLRAAAAAGLKRVIIPASQRIETGPQGALINAENIAQGLGLQLILADDLTEAVQQTLNCTLPRTPDLTAQPRYGRDVFSFLERRCREELKRLESSRNTWTSLESVRTRTDPISRLWREVYRNYELGTDALRSGELYAAQQRLIQANALLRAVTEHPLDRISERLPGFIERAGAVRKRIDTLQLAPRFKERELTRALMVNEEADWLFSVNAELTGAQLVVIEATNPGSTADSKSRALAEAQFIDAVLAAEYKVDQRVDWDALVKLLSPAQNIDSYDRAESWTPQLAITHLAKARLFSQSLRRRANELQNVLVWDTQLAAYSRLLIQAVDEAAALPAAALPQSALPTSPLNAAGFQPGEAYNPGAAPKALQSNREEKLSDVLRCLSWANYGSYLGMLEQKYLQPGGSLDPETLDWRQPSPAELRYRLRLASAGALYGIAFARRTGVDTSALALTHEYASHLNQSENQRDRLEALRQFWRCGMLGILTFQLGNIPKAAVAVGGPIIEPEQPAPATNTPAPTPVPEEPGAARAQKVKPAPAPAVKAVPAPTATPPSDSGTAPEKKEEQSGQRIADTIRLPSGDKNKNSSPPAAPREKEKPSSRPEENNTNTSPAPPSQQQEPEPSQPDAPSNVRRAEPVAPGEEPENSAQPEPGTQNEENIPRAVPVRPGEEDDIVIEDIDVDIEDPDENVPRAVPVPPGESEP